MKFVSLFRLGWIKTLREFIISAHQWESAEVNRSKVAEITGRETHVQSITLTFPLACLVYKTGFTKKHLQTSEVKAPVTLLQTGRHLDKLLLYFVTVARLRLDNEGRFKKQSTAEKRHKVKLGVQEAAGGKQLLMCIKIFRGKQNNNECRICSK